MEEYTDYQYRSLDSQQKEIRLLTLHPPSASAHNVIRCSINHTSLSSQPKARYETISYVWGAMTDRSTVIVEGCSLDVPASAERVLRRMQNQKHDRTVWIDAICIDQHDKEEQGQQVAIMADIYSCGFRGLIWLGDTENEGVVRHALRVIDLLLDEVRRETNDFETLLKHIRPTGAWVYSRAGFSSEISDGDFRSLVYFFDSAWFRRLWVVQEAALSPDSVCFYGNTAVPYLSVVRAACWLRHKKYHLPSYLLNHQGRSNISRVWIYADRQYSPYKQERAYLDTLLSDVRGFEVTYTKDHVFGILGLYSFYASFHAINRPDIPVLLKPDLEKSHFAVLRDATRAAMQERDNLTCWNSLHHDPRNSLLHDGLPSWVPQWHMRSDAPGYPSQLVRFNACGSNVQVKWASPWQDQPEVLSVFGFCADEIVEKLWVFTENAIPNVCYKALECAQASMNLKEGDPSRSNKLSALALTLIGGVDYVIQRSSAAEAREGFEAFMAYINTHAAFPLRGQVHHNACKAAEYHQALRYACLNRSVFLTKSGRIGIGPKTVQACDIVTILYGCDMPVILRRQHQPPIVQELVGTSHIHGMMAGEAILEHQASNGPDEEFNIR